jgi:hypothetical protein
MKSYTIEIDETIMDYLKKYAEPFSDTPNSVLHRLLFGNSNPSNSQQDFQPIFLESMPKALSQVLEVVSKVAKEGKSRPEATKIVAERNKTAPQTIIDKYCRQLGKNSQEVDRLLAEPGLGGFRMILTQKFPRYQGVISAFFNDLKPPTSEVNTLVRAEIDAKVIRPTIYEKGSKSSERKQRDTALEADLKTSLGRQLKKKFGDFQSVGQSRLVFDKARVLSKYSSFHSEQARWFWGVPKTYWQNWENTDHLALIYENETDHGDKYLYVLLDAAEAKELFRACSVSNDEKKINMRIYMDEHLARFQEWKEFDVQARTQPLHLL